MSDICIQLLAELNISNSTHYFPPTKHILFPESSIVGNGISNQSWKPETRELLLTPPTSSPPGGLQPQLLLILWPWVSLQYTNSYPSPSLSSTLVLSLNYLYLSPEILVFSCFPASTLVPFQSILQTPARVIFFPKIRLCLLLLSRFSRVQFCATPWTAAHVTSV